MAETTGSPKAYPTDLTDDQWALVEPLLPPPKTAHGGRPREVVNTILDLNRTGRQSGNRSRPGVAGGGKLVFARTARSATSP